MTTAPHSVPRASRYKSLNWLFLLLIPPVCLLLLGCDSRPDHGWGAIDVPLPITATDLHLQQISDHRV